MEPAALNPYGVLPVVVFTLSWGGTVAAAAYARRAGMLDLPGERHSHDRPTPRGGGAGPVLALALCTPWIMPGSAASQFWNFSLLPGFALLALVGWWDDRVSLSARVRFVAQLAGAGWLLVGTGFTGDHGIVLAFGALLAIVWMVNLYNFMDGSNGMAGAQAVFAGGVLAWLFARAGEGGGSLFALSLAAAALGFLPWNITRRPRVFMGDVGSGPLGFVIAGLLAWGWHREVMTLPVAWLVMLVFVCDSTLTLLTRVMKGERWYTPHKQHLYQCLIQRGWTHGGVLALYQGLNGLLVLPAIAVAVNWPELAWSVAFAATVVLLVAWVQVKKKLGVLARAG
ncbi:MraY family glycosyltransferase [Elongatibacter sediminis]|uniref:Glycosyltransferase family 4 protein n=1 Tax=Elongatibacter sediminis TaxID=3119006 RepID=A0AAW9RBU7_9GAMM